MCFSVDLAVVILLLDQRRDQDEPRSDTLNRQAIPRDAVSQYSANDVVLAQRGLSGELETDLAVVGHCADLPETQHQ